MGWRLSFRLRMICWMHAFQLPMFPLVHSWMLLLLYLLWGSVSCDCHTGMDVSHRFLSWIQFQVLHRNQLRLFSMSSRRTPCGRTPLTESGLAFSVVRPQCVLLKFSNNRFFCWHSEKNSAFMLFWKVVIFKIPFMQWKSNINILPFYYLYRDI